MSSSWVTLAESARSHCPIHRGPSLDTEIVGTLAPNEEIGSYHFATDFDYSPSEWIHVGKGFVRRSYFRGADEDFPDDEWNYLPQPSVGHPFCISNSTSNPNAVINEWIDPTCLEEATGESCLIQLREVVALGEIIGRGGTSVVRIATPKTISEAKSAEAKRFAAKLRSVSGGASQVAVKVIATQTDAPNEPRLLREVAIACQAKHPNVARCFGVCRHDVATSTSIALILELLEAPPASPPSPPQSAELDWIFASLIAGVRYLHEDVGVLHRDIKPLNCLRSSVDGTYKLIDFGIASPLLQTQDKPECFGTPGFMAPESPCDEELSLEERRSADYFAIGKTMRHFFGRNDPGSGKLQRLVADMVADSPKARPSTEALVQHAALLIHRLRPLTISLFEEGGQEGDSSRRISTGKVFAGGFVSSPSSPKPLVRSHSSDAMKAQYALEKATESAKKRFHSEQPSSANKKRVPSKDVATAVTTPTKPVVAALSGSDPTVQSVTKKKTEKAPPVTENSKLKHEPSEARKPKRAVESKPSDSSPRALNPSLQGFSGSLPRKRIGTSELPGRENSTTKEAAAPRIAPKPQGKAPGHSSLPSTVSASPVVVKKTEATAHSALVVTDVAEPPKAPFRGRGAPLLPANEKSRPIRR